jgi:hypothetical protein
MRGKTMTKISFDFKSKVPYIIDRLQPNLHYF